MKQGLLVAAFLAVGLARVEGAATVGSPAPEVAPKEWLNTKTPITWKDLKGRLILVEKWATWCGPCKASIPHLNELHEKFEKKGFTIVAVTEEPAGTVKPFIDSQGMKYAIALGGAADYKTDGIPHGWLVGPRGDVIWEGYPPDLNDAKIEEFLKGASVTPQFSLPKDLKSAERDLNAAKYSDGIKTLETHLKKPKNAETEAAAKAALEQVSAYGTSKLKSADELAKERDYGDAAEILRGLEKSFKGHEVGDKAKTQLADWKKDDKIKLELDAASLIEQSDLQVQAKQFKAAAGLLFKVTNGKKYEGTKAREIAEKRLAVVKRKL